MKKSSLFVLLIIWASWLLNSHSVFAGNGPFFVVYDHHPENKGDIEIMMMTDYARAKVGRDNIAQMLEVEYGGH